MSHLRRKGLHLGGTVNAMRKFLHLGAGPIILRSLTVEWINIDIEQTHKPDICMDYQRLSQEFEPDSIAGVFSCHSFEHLPYPSGVVRALEECYTVMQPGGVIRLVVPDLELVAKAYVAGSDLKFIHGPEFKAYYHKAESRAERFHFFVAERAWQHQICFDFDLLQMLMTDAGFRNVRRMPFGVSEVPELCGIDRFESESLSAQGTK